MKKVLSAEDFTAAREVKAAKLQELGYVSVCMAPGTENAGHSHTLVEEMLIVHKGLGRIQIEDDVYDLTPGSVAIVPAGQFHCVSNIGSDNLEGITVFNRNVDTKNVVLKTREEHFACASDPIDAALIAENLSLKKANKKLKKQLKARKGQRH